MPAASAGNVLFSKLVAFKEATPGTIPTLTSGGRKLLVTPTGVISEGTTIELGTERSVALRNPLIGSTGTIVSVEPTLSATVPAVSVGELPLWLSMTRTDTPSGTAAPYEWDYDYSMTTANSPTSYTLIATDGTQAYAANYCLAESITIAADRNGLTNLSASLFAQQIAKNSATLAEGTPTSPFMSGRLWNAFQHGSTFPGTADGSTMLTGIEEWRDATEAGQVAGCSISQHQNRDEKRQAAKTSGSNRARKSRQVTQG